MPYNALATARMQYSDGKLKMLSGTSQHPRNNAGFAVNLHTCCEMYATGCAS
jgi:hypothetical protein